MNNTTKRMPFSEMLAWTSRLGEVITIVDKRLKKERLTNLRNDFENAYPVPTCQYSESLKKQIEYEFLDVEDYF